MDQQRRVEYTRMEYLIAELFRRLAAVLLWVAAAMDGRNQAISALRGEFEDGYHQGISGYRVDFEPLDGRPRPRSYDSSSSEGTGKEGRPRDGWRDRRGIILKGDPGSTGFTTVVGPSMNELHGKGHQGKGPGPWGPAPIPMPNVVPPSPPPPPTAPMAPPPFVHQMAQPGINPDTTGGSFSPPPVPPFCQQWSPATEGPSQLAASSTGYQQTSWEAVGLGVNPEDVWNRPEPPDQRQPVRQRFHDVQIALVENPVGCPVNDCTCDYVIVTLKNLETRNVSGRWHNRRDCKGLEKAHQLCQTTRCQATRLFTGCILCTGGRV